MLKSMAFLNSHEFPATAPSPIITFPLKNAHERILASFPMISGPASATVGIIFTERCTHMFFPIFRYSVSGNVAPTSSMKLPSSLNTSQGYVYLSKSSFATVSSRSKSFFVFTSIFFIFYPFMPLYSFEIFSNTAFKLY